MLQGIVLLATGIVLFLFGMMKLSAKMQLLFTARIRAYIKYAVRKPIYGLFTGAASTIALQSSSATSVLIIGMVSAGLISFYHSLGMILGADIGTTLTVQLVVWKVTDLSPLFIIAGGVLWLAGKTKWASGGEALFYFGLLFFGLQLTGQATTPLRNNPDLIRFFQETTNPFLGLAIGLLFTGLIHASAIPISILVILAQQGLVTLPNALPIVIGANIGTTVTAIMAGAVSASLNAKRSALAHFLFKLGGAVLSLAALPWFIALLQALSSRPAQQIALGHFLFNLLIVLVFIFLLAPCARLIERYLPGEDEVLPLWPEYLDETCLATAKSALECVFKELAREMTLTRRMYAELLPMLDAYREGKGQKIHYIAWTVNYVRTEIVQYLRHVSSHNLSPALSTKLFAYTGLVDDIARNSDQIVFITGLLKDKAERNIDFSPAAQIQLRDIAGLVEQILTRAGSVLASHEADEIALLFRLEEEIDLRVKLAREAHLARFCEKVCNAEAGPVFVEIMIHLERIADHCQNIAEYVTEINESSQQTATPSLP